MRQNVHLTNLAKFVCAFQLPKRSGWKVLCTSRSKVLRNAQLIQIVQREPSLQFLSLRERNLKTMFVVVNHRSRTAGFDHGLELLQSFLSTINVLRVHWDRRQVQRTSWAIICIFLQTSRAPTSAPPAIQRNSSRPSNLLQQLDLHTSSLFTEVANWKSCGAQIVSAFERATTSWKKELLPSSRGVLFSESLSSSLGQRFQCQMFTRVPCLAIQQCKPMPDAVLL